MLKVLRLILKIALSLAVILILLAGIYAGYLFISGDFDPDAVESGFERLIEEIEYRIDPHAERIEEFTDRIENSLDGVGDSVERLMDKWGD